MLQPLAIAMIGGILISMVLSLVMTLAVHYFLSMEASERNKVGMRPWAGCLLPRRNAYTAWRSYRM